MMPRRCLLALIAVAVFAAGAFGQQDVKVPTIPIAGTEVFCYLLNNHKLAAVKGIAELDDLPSAETMVIVFGKTEAGARDETGRLVRRLRDFHDRGGGVLFASDFAISLNDWGARVAGAAVLQNEALANRNHSDCPMILSLTRDKPAAFHVLARGVAMERPSYFQNDRQESPAMLKALALVPDGCAAPGLGQANPDPAFMLFAEGKNETPGRTLLIAGHGLFTNGMLLQADNDNFEFAVSCLRWLSDRPDGAKRRHALFIVDGQVIPSFDVALKPPLPPIPTPTLQLVNQLMLGLERENFFVNLLRDNVDINGPIRLTLILLTVSLLIYGAKKLTDQRHHAELGSALLVGPYAPPPAQSALVQRRFVSQVQRDGLWEEARALARHWCFESAGIPVSDWDRLPRPRPEFGVVGGWWESLRLRRQANRLFQLAEERTVANFSWCELVRLTSAIQSLNQAARQGRLRIGGCSGVEKP